MRPSNSCQCNHFDRDGGGLAVQDALHDAVALRFSHSALMIVKNSYEMPFPATSPPRWVRANETPELPESALQQMVDVGSRRFDFGGILKACTGHFAVNLQAFRQVTEAFFLWIETKKDVRASA